MNAQPAVAGLMLAGGASRRFGGGKLLHPWAGQSLIEASLRAPLGAGLSEVVVVTGAYHEPLAGVLASHPVRVLFNPDWSEGMSTTLRVGLAALSAGPNPPDAVVICLADQPELPPHVIGALVETYRRTGARLVAPALDGARKNPVLFDRSLFAELAAVTGDEGARSVIQRHQDAITLVPFDQPEWFRDIDQPADL